MAADTSVKVFKSTDTGAPSLSATAGALIAVLDACLLNGYNLLTAQSVTVSSGVATATFATSHGFAAGRVVLVAGATPAGLNGERRVLSATTNSLTIDATGIADGAASGAITLKMAPAGWSKPFSGSNLAVYKPTDPAARTQYIRVDDTGTLDARVCAYEAMTDINTGTRKIPLESVVAGGNYWPKANTTSGTRPWLIVADGKTIYYWVAPHANYPTGGYLVWSGDLKPRRAADAYAWGLSGGQTAVAAGSVQYGAMGYGVSGPLSGQNEGLFIARGYAGLGSAATASRTFPFDAVNAHVFGDASSPLSYPNGPDNSLILTPLLCFHRSHVRGEFPGLYATAQAVGATFVLGEMIDGIEDLDGRTMMALPTSTVSSAQSGSVFVDVTGPWQ